MIFHCVCFVVVASADVVVKNVIYTAAAVFRCYVQRLFRFSVHYCLDRSRIVYEL